MSSVLVTGGAGYIGSHGALALLEAGRRVVIVDNLFRGHRGAVEALKAIGGDRLAFVEADIADEAAVRGAIRAHGVRDVLHFAGLAYVGESVERPLLYHWVNTGAALAFLRACDAEGIERFVFSSTCATYGAPGPEHIPIAEDCPREPINPYGRSKRAFEDALADYGAARRAQGRPFAWAALRYFNVAGCDRAGRIGEFRDPETRIISIALQAALGLRGSVTIAGTDYDTPDGTCIRDFVHVEDLVRAHLLTLDALRPGSFDARRYNLGLGRGFSVREVIDTCATVAGRPILVEEGPRRPGDAPVMLASSATIERELGWRPEVTALEDIVASAWAWMQGHPRGYA